MAALFPCSACRRHLRHQETQCPFCGAQQPPGASAPRQLTLPPGTSRAKIFALGLTLVGQACGGERTDKADSYGCCIPPYGAMPMGRETCADNPLLAGCNGSSGAGGGAGSGAGGSGVGGSAGTDSSGGNAGSGGAAAGAGTSDAGASLDAGAEDAGRDAGDAGT